MADHKQQQRNERAKTPDTHAKKQPAELTEDELKQVSGGAGGEQAPIKMIKGLYKV